MEIIKEVDKVFILNEKAQEVAYVTFPFVEEGVVSFTHTYVAEEFRGMKLGHLLMSSACEVIRERHCKAIVECSYARHWFSNHPECKDILK